MIPQASVHMSPTAVGTATSSSETAPSLLNSARATPAKGPLPATHSVSPDHGCPSVVSCFLATVLGKEKGQDAFTVRSLSFAIFQPHPDSRAVCLNRELSEEPRNPLPAPLHRRGLPCGQDASLPHPVWIRQSPIGMPWAWHTRA